MKEAPLTRSAFEPRACTLRDWAARARGRLLRVLSSLCWLTGSIQAGQVRAAEVEWSAPAQCGDPSSLVSQIDVLSQQPLAAVGDVDFSVHLERDSAGPWRLVLRTRERRNGSESVRELSTASCEEAKDAAAVAIAMAIEARRHAPVEAAKVQPVERPPVKRKVAVEPPPTAADATGGLRLALAAGLAVDAGTLPALAPGPDLEFALDASGLRLIAVISWFPAQTARLSDGASAADIDLMLAGLLACAGPSVRSLRFLGCAGLELGRMTATSIGVRPRVRDASFVYAPRAELGVSWPDSDAVRIWIRAGGVLPLPRNWYTVNGERVHRPGVVGLRATIGVELHL